MRLYLVITCVLLFVGCQSPHGSPDDDARIANSLEKQITEKEARHILVDDIDRSIQASRTTDAKGSRDEVKVLAHLRQRRISELESIMSRSRNGDELWIYRTYVTTDHRGGESDFALVREDRVVEHMRIVIYD